MCHVHIQNAPIERAEKRCAATLRQNGIAYPYNGGISQVRSLRTSHDPCTQRHKRQRTIFPLLQSSRSGLLFCLLSLSTIVFVVANLSLAYAFFRRLTVAHARLRCVCATEQANTQYNPAEDEISFALSRSTTRALVRNFAVALVGLSFALTKLELPLRTNKDRSHSPVFCHLTVSHATNNIGSSTSAHAHKQIRRTHRPNFVTVVEIPARIHGAKLRTDLISGFLSI